MTGPPAVSVNAPPSVFVVCFGASKGRSSTASASIISVKLRCASATFAERNGALAIPRRESRQKALIVIELRVLLRERQW